MTVLIIDEKNRLTSVNIIIKISSLLRFRSLYSKKVKMLYHKPDANHTASL